MQFILDTHSHTISSGHAYSTIKEYVDVAKEKNLKLISITDHAPSMLGAPTKFHFTNLQVIPRVLDGIEVLRGTELSILNNQGEVDLQEPTLKRLDIVLASLHPPCWEPSDFNSHTSAIIGAMENPYINIMGHLGDPRYLFDIEKVVKKAKETNTMIELNNQSFNPINARRGGEKIIAELVKA